MCAIDVVRYRNGKLRINLIPEYLFKLFSVSSYICLIYIWLPNFDTVFSNQLCIRTIQCTIVWICACQQVRQAATGQGTFQLVPAVTRWLARTVKTSSCMTISTAGLSLDSIFKRCFSFVYGSRVSTIAPVLIKYGLTSPS